MIAIYLLVLAISSLYLWLKFVYSYWQRKNFPYIEPSIPFGNLLPAVNQNVSLGINLYELHKKGTDPFVGIYLLFRPALLIRDADLAKNILTTDFASFYDRGVYHNPMDPVSENMLMMPGQRWKNMRAKLTPTFTSGKLKSMFPAIIQIGEHLTRKLSPMAAKGEIVEMKDLLVRYALDVIATVGFGLDVNTIENPNHSFREIEKSVNNGEFVNRIRNVCSFLCPKVLEILHLSSFSDDFKEFMVNIVKETIEHREKNNVSRKDFIQLLIELRKAGNTHTDGGSGDSASANAETSTTDDSFKSMTIEQCAAQVALFYLAGFDTTASAVSYCLYELSRKPDLMKHLQREIDEMLQKHNGVVTYECLDEIKLLDLCVMETIRKYPTLPLLNRLCTKDYPIPNSDLIVKKGTAVVISLLGIMRDPEYFPEPEKFLPERFSEEKTNYYPAAYIPFGDGPRACIGMRMGKIVTKIGLILLLQKYTFEYLDKRELEFDNHSITLVVKGGIHLRVTNRNIESE